MPIKKGVFIGINYVKTPQATLRGCYNDAIDVLNYTYKTYGIKQVALLTDVPTTNKNVKLPTKKNILDAFKWLTTGLVSGDCVFVHYSGHGGQQRSSQSVDWEEDGMDETIYSSDFQTVGCITDNEIRQLLADKIPAGCKLTFICDACHSASICDLPMLLADSKNRDVVYNNRSIISRGDVPDLLPEINSLLVNFDDNNVSFAPNATVNSNPSMGTYTLVKYGKIPETKGEVITISGCRDRETSADAYINNTYQGACSAAYLDTMSKFANKNPSYYELTKNMNDYLRANGYTQVSQMYFGKYNVNPYADYTPDNSVPVKKEIIYEHQPQAWTGTKYLNQFQSNYRTPSQFISSYPQSVLRRSSSVPIVYKYNQPQSYINDMY